MEYVQLFGFALCNSNIEGPSSDFKPPWIASAYSSALVERSCSEKAMARAVVLFSGKKTNMFKLNTKPIFRLGATNVSEETAKNCFAARGLQGRRRSHKEVLGCKTKLQKINRGQMNYHPRCMRQGTLNKALKANQDRAY